MNLWNSDYIGNPENRWYVSSAKQLNMDWMNFRDMYLNLNLEPKRELDKYLLELTSREIHKETQDFIELLNRLENQTSKHSIQFRYAAIF